MATPEIQTWAESEQLSAFSSQWFPVNGVCALKVLDLFFFIPQTALSWNLLYLSCSTFLSEFLCSYCCLLSPPVPIPESALALGMGKAWGSSSGWGEKSPLPQWCVCGCTAFPSLCLDTFFVHHVSMKTTENPETSHWSRINFHCSEHWLVSVWSLALSRWPKGVCMERTLIFVGGLNILVLLFI